MAIARSRRECLKRTAKRLHKTARTPAQRRTVLGRASKACSRKKMVMRPKRRSVARKPRKQAEPTLEVKEYLSDVLERGIRMGFSGLRHEELVMYLQRRIPDELQGPGTLYDELRIMIESMATETPEVVQKALVEYLMTRVTMLTKKPLTVQRLKDTIKGDPSLVRLWRPFELE